MFGVMKISRWQNRKTTADIKEHNAEQPYVRAYEKPMSAVITALLALWAVLHIWSNISGALSTVSLRIAHVMGLLIFSFSLYGYRRKCERPLKFIPLLDIFFIFLSIACLGYMICRYPTFAKNGRLTDMDIWTGVVCIALVFEAARRVSGKLLLPALLFFSYFAVWGRFLSGEFGIAAFTIKRVVKALAWDNIGIFGTGVGVSATYIFIFVLFGSFLQYSGFSTFINDIALALLGHSPGGPAKVSIIASAFMGMINGSAVANVATTGVITIPLMKKTGYKKEFAAAVEAVASTGGQFAPPIMGAVGFVMAEFMAVGYMKVLLAAAIPAFLYYLGLLFSVHLEAKRLGLSGVSGEDIPKILEVMKERGHLSIPLVVLFAMMFSGYTPLFSAITSIAVLIPASWLRKDTRLTYHKIIIALAEGSRSAVSVGVSCALIGIIIGSVNMTGLGVNFGALILKVVGKGQTFLGGLMVMVMTVILGMGVPGVAAYVIVYAVAVPVLKSVGITDMAANMFCLIYACLGNITPPVAISSYVASSIAGSDVNKTSLLAVRLGVVGFIVPFFFLNNPVLLLGNISSPVWMIIWSFLTACSGVLVLTKGLSALPVNRSKKGRTTALILSRIVLVAAGLLFINTSIMTDVVAVVLTAVGIKLSRYHFQIEYEKEVSI